MMNIPEAQAALQSEKAAFLQRFVPTLSERAGHCFRVEAGPVRVLLDRRFVDLQQCDWDAAKATIEKLVTAIFDTLEEHGISSNIPAKKIVYFFIDRFPGKILGGMHWDSDDDKRAPVCVIDETAFQHDGFWQSAIIHELTHVFVPGLLVGMQEEDLAYEILTDVVGLVALSKVINPYSWQYRKVVRGAWNGGYIGLEWLQKRGRNSVVTYRGEDPEAILRRLVKIILNGEVSA